MGTYLAVDPGDGKRRSIGFVVFEDARPVISEQLTFNEFIKELDELHSLEAIICEDYRIRRDTLKTHSGSRVETLQTIGALRMFSVRHNYPLVLQASNILSIAEKHFNITLKGMPHSESHRFSAMLHGLHYLHQIGVAKTALEVKFERGEL